MFGGYGIRCAEFPIALIIDQRLFLKVDDLTKPRFRDAGCEPFVYGEKGKPMEMSYWSAPEAAMDSPGLMQPWAMLALQAAMRAKAPKPRSRSSAPADATTRRKR
jgi:DNA transformation protein